MPIANLNKEGVFVGDSRDSIVIVKALGDIPGGRTLEVADVAAEYIRAGHVLIQNNTSKVVKPLGVSGSAYASLPSGWSYLGVLKASVNKNDPRAAIMTIGQVNAAASPYPVTAAIKSGLPRIEFLNA